MEDLAAKLGYASPNATSSTAEQIAEIGTTTIGQLVSYYEYLNQNNAYTPDRGATIAASIAPTVDAKIPYGMHTIESIESTTDTSKNSVIAYRQALQTSLAPLKKNPGYELDIYNNYLQTKDELYMSQLKTMAANYHTAVNLTTKVTPPRDAVTIHVDILNSLTQFGTTLDFMIQNVDNPVTSLALLRAYDRAEQDMFDAFSGINSYYLKKKIYE